MSDMENSVTVKVFRFDPGSDAQPYYDTFAVPYDEQETILGVLKTIMQQHDASLAIRESCRIGNCLACTLRVNGKKVLSCRQTLKDFDTRELVIEPLDMATVIRDLVCDL